MTNTTNRPEDEFRFAENSDCCVLQKRELIENYRVRGVDHEGNPFATSIGLWKRLKPATEEDFRALRTTEADRAERGDHG